MDTIQALQQGRKFSGTRIW